MKVNKISLNPDSPFWWFRPLESRLLAKKVYELEQTIMMLDFRLQELERDKIKKVEQSFYYPRDGLESYNDELY